MDEEWKLINEAERRQYFISKIGQVKSRSVNGVERILKPGGGEYLSCVCGKNIGTRSIHRLVAIAFVPNPDNLPEVDHIDGNKHNNVWTNLRWVTRGQQLLNCKKRSDNSTGHRGVTYDKTNNRWSALWSVDGVHRRKWFDNIAEAISHREQMVIDHYDPNHYIHDR
jgi:hypothetical protein